MTDYGRNPDKFNPDDRDYPVLIQEDGVERAEDTLTKLEKMLNPVTKVYEVSGSSAISKATTVGTDYPGKKWRLKKLEVAFSSAPTTSENFTITKSSPHSDRPDTVLFSEDPSATSATSILQLFEEGGVDMEPEEEVTMAYTNTDGNTVKALLEVEVIDG